MFLFRTFSLENDRFSNYRIKSISYKYVSKDFVTNFNFLTNKIFIEKMYDFLTSFSNTSPLQIIVFLKYFYPMFFYGGFMVYQQFDPDIVENTPTKHYQGFGVHFRK